MPNASSSSANGASQAGKTSDFTGTTTGYGKSSGGAVGGSNVDVAPSYVDAEQQAVEGVQKPKGRNIQEGGFDEGAPNASFNSGIGTKNDPARLAEQKFDGRNAQIAADVGYERDGRVSGDGQYDVLKVETA